MTATQRTVRRLAVLVALALLAPLLVTVAGPATPASAAGGPQPIPGGLWDTTPAVSPGQSYLAIDGQEGDWLSGGQDTLFTKANSDLTVTYGAKQVYTEVRGDAYWTGILQAMNSISDITVGYYPDVVTYPNNGPDSLAAMRWTASNRACNVTGWFAVDEVAIAPDGELVTFTARFFQSCNGGPGFYGKLHWNAADTTLPPGPQVPVPDGLWDIAPAVAPGQSYLAIDGTTGDYVSAGQDRLYTKADSRMAVTLDHREVTVSVEGDQRWSGTLRSMIGVDPIAPGYYPNITGNSTLGWLWWTSDGRTCSSVTGWFAVDEITITNGTISMLTARFFQSCNNKPGVYGKLHWDAADPTVPAGPQPTPNDLWDIAPAVGPNQTFVALDGLTGDWPTAGADFLHTKADSDITATVEQGHLSVRVDGDVDWSGDFRPMDGVDPLSTGYYPGATSYYVGNPTRAGLRWSGNSRGCNTTTGWFAIDQLTLSAGVVTSLTLRFFQVCDNGPGMYGKIRIDGSDTTAPPLPQPIPDDLWDASPAVGAGRAYVVVDGNAGDYVSQGQDHLYTKADSDITVQESNGNVFVSVSGDESWTATFDAMDNVTSLVPGYYPGAKSPLGSGPYTPAISWHGEGRTCGDENGWFAVDEVSRSGDLLTSLTLRFFQRCGAGPGMYGKIRYVASDTTPPARPAPIPGDLWDTTPAVGAGRSYVAIDSQAGDNLANGADALYTRANSALSLTENGKDVTISVNGDRQWSGTFRPMEVLSSLETGYYSQAAGLDALANPKRGGMSWQGCSGGTSWFAVDELSRVSGAIETLTIRFAVSCGGSPPLHGKVHWDAADTTPVSGLPTPIPGGLWDTAAPVGSGLSYAVFDSEVGDPIANGTGGTFSRANARISVSESQGVLNVQVDESATTWRGKFATVPGTVLSPGYYGSPAALPTPNPARSSMSWARGTYGTSPSPCTLNDGWFAVDQLTRSAGQITSLTLRFDITCDGVHHLKGKLRWLASDTTTPGLVNPVPDGLWDVTPPGVTGNYVFIDGVAGDPVTNGADFLLQDPQRPGVPSDYQGQIVAIIGTADPQDFWLAEFDGIDDQGRVQPGYYPNLSSVSSPSPVMGGVRVTHLNQNGRSCNPGTTTGWFAVDRLGRIDGKINRIDLRFEQSCDGSPPMHGRLHYDFGGLDVGPPIGAFESAVPVTGGVKVDGWALDPETASAIDVDVLVDGVVTTTLNASGARPDVGAANPLYGAGHGFSANVTVPVGTHQVCTKTRNTGVGTDTTLGCKTVKVGSGSPFGSFDVAYGGPLSVSVAGWAIDPDTSLPIPVHVYVDATGAAFTADGSRPDVEGAFPGYGPAHGFSGKISTTPGTHNVCAYALNVGTGSTTGLGCKTVTVISGSPIGSLDIATLVPGVGVNVGGWALDPDTTNSIPVHVYVDGKGVALTANGSRPDIGSFFPGYGPAHGFSSTISTGPGLHTVCAYGINAGAGATTTLGCKVVNVPTGSPIGSLDLVSGGKGYVSAGGWAADPDTAAPIAVHLYVDAAGSAVTANLNRPDVGAYFPPWGPLHGWATTVNAAPGVHNVCAYAINVGAGSTTLLGCRLVAVT